MDNLIKLFSTDGFMPHGSCYLWTPALLWTLVVSEALIGLAYFSIPFSLLLFVSKRKSSQFIKVYQLFSLFIFSCGITHLLGIWTIWHPDYWLDAFVKVLTAVVSLFAAAVLWDLMPNALKLPSTKQLEMLVANLEQEVAQRKISEAELMRLKSASDERFRILFESTRDAVVIFTTTGRCLDANPAAVKMFECADTAELKTKTPVSLSPEFQPDGQRSDEKALEKICLAIADGSQLFEWTHQRKNGRSFPVEVLLTRVQYSDETVLVSSGRDISERKKIECALQKSEERYRVLSDLLPVQIWTARADGKLDYVNQRVLDFFGQSYQDLIKDSLQSALHPDDFADTLACWTSSWKTGQAFERELRLRHHSGEYRWCIVRALPARDQQGCVQSWYGTNTDITDRKIAEEAVKERENLFRSLASIAPVVIYRTDAQGKCVFVNETWKELSGFSLQSAYGEGWRNTIYPEDRQRVFQEWQAAFTAGDQFSSEYRIMTAEGDVKCVIGRAIANYHENGLLLGYTGTLTDISERKQIELELFKAKQIAENSTRLKSEFLANMSHEIRNPMNAIFGLSELILNEDISGKVRNYQEKIQKASDSLLSIVNDILDFSKIESHHLEIEKNRFKLDDILTNLSNLFLLATTQKQFTLNFKVSPDVPRDLIGDALRIQQILTNLLSNAIKFTEQGSVLLLIKQLQTTKTHSTLQFVVEDTGIGISDQDLSKLFQPFGQANSSISRRFGGTGLGLAISQGLLKLMGSEFQVTSKVGVGSVFSFSLVLETCHAIDTENELVQTSGRAGRLSQKMQQAGKNLQGIRILLAEDNDTNQTIIKDMLELSQINVDIANNGTEVLARLTENTYDAVLMDVHMPQMDGIEATEWIRAQAALRDLPVIALTADVTLMKREHYLARGFNELIAKPFRPETLIDTLNRLLRDR